MSTEERMQAGHRASGLVLPLLLLFLWAGGSGGCAATEEQREESRDSYQEMLEEGEKERPGY